MHKIQTVKHGENGTGKRSPREEDGHKFLYFLERSKQNASKWDFFSKTGQGETLKAYYQTGLIN